MKPFQFLYFLFFMLSSINFSFSQTIDFVPLYIRELKKINSLSSNIDSVQFSDSLVKNSFDDYSFIKESKKFSFDFTPFFFNTRFDSKRPYSDLEYGMIPSRGFQSYISSGFKLKISSIYLQFQPEFIISQNLSFSGLSNSFSTEELKARYLYWNIGDSPERFGNDIYLKFFLGQSKIGFNFKSFEISAGTKNFWWGPSQWNSLIFSNNAPGFPYISFNTIKPTKTFIGNFEGQVLVGKLNSSNFSPTQIDEFDSKFFAELNSDWRYLNGLLLSYNPIFLNGLTLGYMRTFQYYNKQRPKTFSGLFPIFEPMAKDRLFKNGNAVVYDSRKQSQQISIFTSYKFYKAKAELYFLFGRRDHALNWREFILNPEHARAYQFGFIKLFNVLKENNIVQVRGEITHQQESVNRYLRYNLYGENTWHTHGQVRGFTNYGQPMGVGIGTGSNVQSLEIALVDNVEKFGILFERLENNKDFYYRAFGLQSERKPWIDFSISILFNTSYKDLFISSKFQGVFARNYQWELLPKSTSDFSSGLNLPSFHSQINLIYLLNNKD